MTFEELMEELESIIPNCKLRKDRDGQVVIYTRLVDDGFGDLVPMDEDEEVELPEDEDLVSLEDEDDDE